MGKEKTSSEHAKIVMMIASHRTPNSPTGLAARIAEYSQLNQLNPIKLRDALLVNAEALASVETEAIKYHIRSGRGPVDIPRSKTVGVVNTSFTLAHEMMCLDLGQLRALRTTHYQESRARAKSGQDPEEILERIADQMVRELAAKAPDHPLLPIGGLRNW